MLTVDKPVSLVQQKKQQWAQEREEMSNLYLPWGTGERHKNRLPLRNQFMSSLELHKQPYEYHEPIQRQRSPSLPPIYNTEQERVIFNENRVSRDNLDRNTSCVKRFSFYEDDAEGDTSGYGSETVNHMNIRNQNRNVYSHTENPNSHVMVAWHQEVRDTSKNQPPSIRSNLNEGAQSARSQSGPEEGRLKWGDRGVATGRLWEPTAPTERLPQMQNHKKGTPSWVERGLNNMIDSSDVLIIDHRESINSGIDCDRSSCNGSEEGRTFLRGQNVPLEPEVKAQRENKRIKALELQSAILSQLEEREKRRQEEREKQLREERLEELRIQRQQEADRIRIEEEKRKSLEKQALEKSKLETLKKALEDAELRARQEKEKRFNFHKQTNEIRNPIIRAEGKLISEARQPSPTKTLSPTKTHRTYNVPSSPTSQIKETNSHQSTAFNSPRSTTASNLNLFIHNIQPHSLTENHFNLVPISISGNGGILNGQSNNSFQLAVLIPQNLNKNDYNVSQNSNESISNEKLLTPSKYRSLKIRDAYTQTDLHMCPSSYEILKTEDIGTEVYKDYSNIDENAPQDTPKNNIKRERRLRSEERYKKDIENRPKWGVNRPVAQYKKQSEKDPFYTQKRKTRQKYRTQVRQYVSQSSEDSRSPSPLAARNDKTLESLKPRNSLSQSFWRSKRYSQDSSTGNVEETTNNTTSVVNSLLHVNQEKKSPKLTLTKRLTLSQKFINDKYGSKILWTDEGNERIPKNSLSDIPVIKKSEKNSISKKDSYDKSDQDQ